MLSLQKLFLKFIAMSALATDEVTVKQELDASDSDDFAEQVPITAAAERRDVAHRISLYYRNFLRKKYTTVSLVTSLARL